MAHDIFISYSNKDKTTAHAICSYMENRGIRCWYAPRDIQPGADWAGSIIDAITASKVLVLIFTEHSNISPQVLREISNAVSAGVPVIPFKLTEEEPVAGMKYYLSAVHWLDAMNDDLESSIANLYELCRVLVNKANGVPLVDKDAALAEQAAISAALPGVPGQGQTGPGTGAADGKKKIGLIAGIAAVLLLAVILIVSGIGGKGGDQDVSENGGTGTSEPSGGVTSEGISTDVTETYTQGNSQAVLQSGGYIATDGELYYYRSNDGQYMFSMKPDGSDVTQLTFEPVAGISVYDGYIYYYTTTNDPTIKRMKTDGSDMSILHQGRVEDVVIVGDRIYYKDSLNGLHMYSMDLDGKNVKAENSIDETYYSCLDGKYMYWSNQEDGGKLYRVNIDGSDPVKLSDHQVEQMTIAGNSLYYNDLAVNKFCSYDLSTGEVTELYDDYIAYINVTSDGIFGYSGAHDTYLCYLQNDGLGFRILLEEPVRNVGVCGNKIMYQNTDDSKLYMVDLDGNNKFEP